MMGRSILKLFSMILLIAATTQPLAAKGGLFDEMAKDEKFMKTWWAYANCLEKKVVAYLQKNPPRFNSGTLWEKALVKIAPGCLAERDRSAKYMMEFFHSRGVNMDWDLATFQKLEEGSTIETQATNLPYKYAK